MPALPNRSIPADGAPAPFADGFARAEVDKERVILTRAGRPVAAVVSMEDLAALEAWEAREDELDAASVRAGLAEDERSGQAWATLEDVAAEHDIKL